MKRRWPLVAWSLAGVGSALFLARGIWVIVESDRAAPLIVSGLSVVVILGGTAWWVAGSTLRQRTRTATVRKLTDDELVLSAMRGDVRDTLIVVTSNHPKVARLGNLYVVSVGDAGLSFWAGPPAQPERRFSLPWSAVSDVQLATALVGRVVPAVGLTITHEGRSEPASFAVGRQGRWAGFAMLDDAPVKQVVDAICAVRNRVGGAEAWK